MVHTTTGWLLPELIEIYATPARNEVFVKALKGGKVLMFKFAFNVTKPDSYPKYFVQQVSDPFGEDPLDGEDYAKYFRDEYECMQQFLREAIDSQWQKWVSHYRQIGPDTVFQIVVEEFGQILCFDFLESYMNHENSYRQFVEPWLKTNRDLHAGDGTPWPLEIEYSEIIRESIGAEGNNRTTPVKLKNGKHYHMERIGLETYLRNPKAVAVRIAAFYNDIRFLRGLSFHPNIISSYPIYVTIKHTGDSQQNMVCGTLLPVMENGSLNDLLVKSMSDKNWNEYDILRVTPVCFQVSFKSP